MRRVFTVARERKIRDIVVAGGVASNGRLRELLNNKKKGQENIIIPSPVLCTDNAAMVAGLGFRYYMNKEYSDLSVDVFSRA